MIAKKHFLRIESTIANTVVLTYNSFLDTTEIILKQIIAGNSMLNSFSKL